YATMNDDVPTVPLIIAHDAGGSVATVEPVIRSVVGRRTVLAFDLPGAGESEDTLGKANLEIDHYAEVIRTILNTFGLTQVDFFGQRGGGFVGLDLALKDKSLVRRLIMASLSHHDGDDLQKMEDNAAPDLSPQWHGGHLLQAWHQTRDQVLYYPWFDRTRAHVVKREPQLDVNTLHTRTCALLKAGDSYRAAVLAQARYRTYEKLAQTPVPTVIGTTKWDPNNAQTEEAAKKVTSPHCRLRYLDEDFGKWGESFLDVLEDADRKG
ncbi:MAG: alpha/beta fold hydrolase, partial [Rhodospirillaceae bacterium]|nr:alpha/beta fold hydrolase [Rhodospirillaceae bacterium]